MTLNLDGNISATKISAGDGQVSGRQDFIRFLIFSKKVIFYLVIQDFRISGSGGHISGTRNATGDPLVAK